MRRRRAGWRSAGRICSARGGGRGLAAAAANVHVERTTFPATTGELGAWYRRGGQRVTLSAVTVNTSTVSTLIFSDQTVVRVQRSGALRRRFADRSRCVAPIRGGRDRACRGTRGRGSSSRCRRPRSPAAWWMMPNVAIAAAVGRQLADPIRGTVRARYATVALRLSAERHGPVAPLRKPPTVSPGSASLIATPDGQGVDGGAGAAHPARSGWSS